MALDVSGGDSLFWKAGIDTSDFTKALKTVEDALNQSTQNGAQAQEQIFKALKQGADGVDHSMHNMAGSIEDAMGAIPKATNQALLSTKQIAQQLEGVTTNWQQLNTAFHGIFHGKSGEESLGYAWSNGLKQGKVSLSQFVESLKLTDKQLAGLPEKLEKAGYVAKGTFSAAATETNKLADSAGHLAHIVSDSITTMQSKIQGLQGQTIELKAKGVDTAQLETSLTKLQGMVDHLQHEELTVQAGNIDTSGMVAALDKVQSEFDSLSKETLNLKVGAIDTASVQKAIGDLKKDITGLQGAAIELQVKGINTDSLTASLKKVETQANALHDITLSADLDESAFQKDYLKLVAEIRKIDTETIKIKAEGVDTSAFEASLSGIKNKVSDLGALSKVAGASRESISTLTAGVSELGSSLNLLSSIAAKGAGLDGLESEAKNVGNAFVKVIGQAEDLKTAVSNIGGGVIAFNTTGIDDAIQQINKAKNIPPVNVPVTFSIGSLNEMTATLDDIKKQYAELSAIDRGSDIGKGMLNNINQLQGELDEINKGFQSIAKNAVGSLDAKVATLEKLKREYSALSEADRNSDVGRSLAKNIKGLDRDIAKVNAEISQTTNLAQQAATALGAYFTLSAAKNFITDMINVRGEFQKLEVAFQTMLGSKAKADKLMQQAVELAATTPFELQDVASGAKQLLAYGFAADNLTDTLKMLGNVASGVGTDLSGLVYLYGTLKTSGRVTIMDLQQFAGRGVPIFETLSKQLGVANSEIRHMVSEGKIGFPQIEQAFKSMTSAGGMFYNLMEKQSQTLTGQISNLKDAWSQMLNDMGKRSEGALSGGINAALLLVKNYQTVLDILKVLVLTYGSYKTAIIATSLASKELSAAQTLLAVKTAITEKVTKLLNSALLANPYTAVAVAMTALISAMVMFHKESLQVKTAQEAINDAMSEANGELSSQEQEIRHYVEVLSDQNVAEETRLAAYNKLKEIAPQILQQLTFQEAKTKDLTVATNEYITALRNRIMMEKYQAEYKKALDIKTKAEDEALKAAKNNSNVEFAGSEGYAGFTLGGGDVTKDAQKALNQAVSTVAALEKKMAGIFQSGSKEALQGEIARLETLMAATDKEGAAYKKYAEQLANYRKQLEALGKNDTGTKAQSRTLAVIEAEIKAEKEKQTNLSTTSKEYLQYQQNINALEKEAEAIRGRSKAAIKAQQTEENKINSLLESRKGILEQIAALQRDAKQSGLIKEQSEIDKINEKYDKVLQNVDEYNKKVAAFNKVNNTRVQGIGQLEVNKIQEARKTEVTNAELKLDAENYLKELDKTKQIFEQYEETKKQIGVQKSKEMFSEQTKGFESYLDFLQKEAAKVAIPIALGIGNIGDTTKLKGLLKEIESTTKKQSEENFKQQVADYQRLFQETQNFAQKRLAIEAQYEKDLEHLKKNYKRDDLESRKKVLKEMKDADLKSLGESIMQQSASWKKLNKDIIGFTKDRINQEIKALEASLNTSGLSSDKVQGIKKAIEAWKKLNKSIDKSTNDTVFGFSKEKLSEIAGESQKVANAFLTLADAFGPIDQGLSDTLRQVGELANATSNIMQGFATGGVVGGAVAALTEIVNVFAEAKKSANESKKAVRDFYENIKFGELETAKAIRERAIEQAKASKLTLDALKAEKKALEENKKAQTDNYNAVLAALQKEQYISGEKAKKGHGSLLFGAVGYLTGLGGKTKVEQELKSLAGMTYDQLEDLFNKGQLTDKAKELFQELQKLKQEGVDIDAQLAELKTRTQEIFTGTTADNITDTIVSGFENGKRAVQDFATDTEDLIRGALLNALKYNIIEKQVQALYEQFAADAEDGGGLDLSEVEAFTSSINKTIEDAAKFAEQVEKATGVSLAKATSEAGSGNSLAGAIKGITEDQANIIAGAMNATRMTALEHLNVARQKLDQLKKIEANTAGALVRLASMDDRWSRIENQGLKVK